MDYNNENNKNFLMLCELHHPAIHGKTETSNNFIYTHYLVYDIFTPYTILSHSYGNQNYHYSHAVELLTSFYLNHGNKLTNHPTIRNYKNIVRQTNYIKLEIGQYILLPTLEAIAILKTFWIRIIQRKWKKIFTERKQVLSNRMKPNALYIRQITGKWPDNCNYLPGLKGMLNNI